jgi:hypothetical protein
LLDNLEPHLAIAVLLERYARPRGIEPKRIHAALAHGRIEAEQRPVTARGCACRLLHPEPHVSPMGDALRIGEDERRTVIRLGFAERDDRLLVVRAHRDLGDVDVAVGDRHHREVLARHLSSRGRELCRGAERRRFRGLPASIGVHLGVEHENVDVVPGGKHVVEAAVADIVGPTVDADDLHGTPHEEVGERSQVLAIGIVHRGDFA